jgi:hypothetical protein
MPAGASNPAELRAVKGITATLSGPAPDRPSGATTAPPRHREQADRPAHPLGREEPDGQPEVAFTDGEGTW